MNKYIVTLLLITNSNYFSNISAAQDPKYNLLWGIKNNEIDFVRKAIDLGININMSLDNNSVTPIHMASIANKGPIIELLIQNGANINGQDTYSRTPLFFASYHGNEAGAEAILKLNASIAIENKNTKFNSLLAAAYNGHTNIVKLLVQYGVNINIQDQYGQTSLFTAVCKNQISTVKALLALGADPNIPSYKNNTVLHLACQNNNIEILELLLQHEINISYKNRQQKTALDIAIENNHQEIIKILTEATQYLFILSTLPYYGHDLDEPTADLDIEIIPDHDIDEEFVFL